MISARRPIRTRRATCNAGFKDVFPASWRRRAGRGRRLRLSEEALTIADQLDAKGLSWKGYMEDMGADPTREPATCAHPDANAQDGTQTASATDQCAHAPQPFVTSTRSYDDQKRCDAHVVNLSALPGDLASRRPRPNLVFVTPTSAPTGRRPACADGRPGGLTSVDVFLASGCRGSRARRPMPTAGCSSHVMRAAAEPGLVGRLLRRAERPEHAEPGRRRPGGGQTGAVVLSPFTAPGSVNDTPYNHYALLRSLEDLFGLGHLGYAGSRGSRASAATCSARRPPST